MHGNEQLTDSIEAIGLNQPKTRSPEDGSGPNPLDFLKRMATAVCG